MPWNDCIGVASPFLRADVLVATGLLIAVLLTGALLFFYAERWKRRALQAEEFTTTQDLAEFRAMLERGDITEEEYERIRQRAAQRLKNELGLAGEAAQRPTHRGHSDPNLNNSAPPPPPAELD